MKPHTMANFKKQTNKTKQTTERIIIAIVII